MVATTTATTTELVQRGQGAPRSSLLLSLDGYRAFVYKPSPPSTAAWSRARRSDDPDRDAGQGDVKAPGLGFLGSLAVRLPLGETGSSPTAIRR